MSYQTLTDEPTVKTGDRSVDFAWHVGDRLTEGYRPVEKQVMVVLAVHHDKRDKQLVARLHREEREVSDWGYTREFAIGGRHFLPSVTVAVEPVARYSEKAFNAFGIKALAALHAADDDRVRALFLTTTNQGVKA